MKILIVSQHYFPENFQITDICEQLVKDGYDVTVLAGLPNYPIGVVPEKYRKGHRYETINGVKIIRCYERGRKKGPINLFFNYLSFWMSASKKITKLNRYDLVFVYQLSPVTMGLPAVKYSKKYNVPMITYCCDLWPESVKMYIKNEKNIFFKIADIISKIVYFNSERIICQSASFINYFETHHKIKQDKLAYIPAFGDDTYLSIKTHIDNNITDFVFLGNLGIAQNLFKILDAVNLIKDNYKFKVHFVGDGTCFDELQNYTAEKKLGNIVKFYGRKPIEEMVGFYELADVCILSLQANNFVGLTLPTKLQGYLAAGKPVLGMINGSAKNVIEESKCGICVPADDVDSFAKAMIYFINNNDKLDEFAKNARYYYNKNFNRETIFKKIEAELDNFLK